VFGQDEEFGDAFARSRIRGSRRGPGSARTFPRRASSCCHALIVGPGGQWGAVRTMGGRAGPGPGTPRRPRLPRAPSPPPGWLALSQQSRGSLGAKQPRRAKSRWPMVCESQILADRRNTAHAVNQ
jgi:hypothetical protein